MDRCLFCLVCFICIVLLVFCVFVCALFLCRGCVGCLFFLVVLLVWFRGCAYISFVMVVLFVSVSFGVGSVFRVVLGWFLVRCRVVVLGFDGFFACFWLFRILSKHTWVGAFSGNSGSDTGNPVQK